jgi:hypothetical protein
MRSDMKKVVTERPRGGGGAKTPKGEKRAWQRVAVEELPRREKIRAKWIRHGAKHFTDVLGPLHRFLLGQVGRPWDLVYSEIARNLPKTSVQNIHVYTHLWQFVEKNVILIDRVPCYGDGFYHGVPIHSHGGRTQLYVHPSNGLLCKAKPGRSRYGYRSTPLEVFEPGVKIYPGVQYHKVQGVWYEVQVQKHAPHPYVHPGVLERLKDDVLGRSYKDLNELTKIYGGRYLAVSKRPLKKREVLFAGLAW